MSTLAELAIEYRESKESKDIQKKLDTLVDETYNEIINDWILNSEKGKFKVIGIHHIRSTIFKIITTKIQSLALPDINCYDISILVDRVCSKLDNDYRVCGYRGACGDEIKKSEECSRAKYVVFNNTGCPFSKEYIINTLSSFCHVDLLKEFYTCARRELAKREDSTYFEIVINPIEHKIIAYLMLFAQKLDLDFEAAFEEVVKREDCQLLKAQAINKDSFPIYTIRVPLGGKID